MRFLRALRDFLEMRRLAAEDRQIVKGFDASRAEAKSQHELFEIDHAEHFERSLPLDQIAQIRSRRLCLEAGRYDIPLPHDNESWYESRVIGGRSLSDKGFHDLRNAIRAEKNARWQYWEVRMKVLGTLATAVTGAAGALIGLFAILKK